MFGIYLQNTFLDLYPDTVLSFELNSPLYFGDDIDVLQGSFMFTINAPLTPHNAKLLRHPNIIDNEETFLENQAAQVFTNGSDILRGSLSVTNSTKREVAIKIQIASDSYLIETLVSDFFKNDTVDIFSENIYDYMYNTCKFPLDYPYIFHPVYNESFENDTTNLPDGVKWQNAIKIVQKINVGVPSNVGDFGNLLAYHTAVTPFMRLEYVLKEIFKRSGLVLDNQFQKEDEMKLITLYNNRTMLNWVENNDYETEYLIKIRHHLPNIQTGGWLKKIVRLFNQGIFVDRFDNQASIVSSESILQDETVAADWSNKVLKNYAITEVKNAIGKYNFEENSENLAYFKYFTGDGDKEYKAAYMPLISGKKTPPNSVANTADLSVPVINQEGSKIYFDATNNTEAIPRLMLYRGFADNTYDDKESLAYPLTCFDHKDAYGNPVRIGWNTNYPISGTPNFPVADAQHTLAWTGEKGIYAKYWSLWNTFLTHKRILKMQLALTPRDIQNFKFQQKVRINNRIYLVKKLKLNITRKGLQAVEAELVSVIGY
jgi:hypothetical protein